MLMPLAGTSAFREQETFLWRRSGMPKSPHDSSTSENVGALAVAVNTTAAEVMGSDADMSSSSSSSLSGKGKLDHFLKMFPV